MKVENHQYILKQLGQKIRELRLSKSISQEELASLADVHRTYIGMIERGEKNTTILTLINISEALGVDMVDIIREIKRGKSSQ